MSATGLHCYGLRFRWDAPGLLGKTNFILPGSGWSCHFETAAKGGSCRSKAIWDYGDSSGRALEVMGVPPEKAAARLRI